MEAYKVHPLVLVEISDYFTRTKMNIDPPEAEPDRLIGCLLGTQTPREVEINSSFECLYARPDGANGAIELDWKFLSEQKDRYKQTHAKLEIVGWYSTGEALDPVVDVAVTRALASRGVAESPVFMLYDPYLNDKKAEAYERAKQAASSAGGGGGSGGNSGGGGGGDDAAVGPMEGINTRDALTGAAAEIPIGLHRAVQRGGDVLALELVKYSIVTDEAERIAIDDLMRAGDWGQQTPAGQYLSHLRGMADATRMLETRVGAVLNHLRDSGATPIDHDVVRAAMRMMRALPGAGRDEEDDRFDAHKLEEMNDTLMTSYLTTITKGVAEIERFADKARSIHWSPYDRVRVVNAVS
ncbi:uncharacterized protein MICPUCDRAFT_40181 [Micromonas pusilla CCMP1545]|uniref:Predicted protein n=1 Tax=Micromonas pusilla (strain CCMP1545) TaxID=564608 RepID=C1MUC9_MICPC|nr:uncharacterized protein MICPUCDRAFT_40181 [Micromonas pusilla CCMP1545]EEH56608.1 predicted protein [Micromonas pusilla CCMP1545]|eukprot:XP_003059476.1 predicted protein [Micromonas pusilla CCMP1545]